MHFKYDTEMNQNQNCNNSNNTVNLSDNKYCSTSSTDSGVILIDNTIRLNNAPNNVEATTKDNNYINNKNGRSEATTKEEPRISIEHTVNINKASGSTGASTKKTSPTLSIRSTTISIVSIDENALDSSCIDSDSEAEADNEDASIGCTVQKLGQQISYPPNSSKLPELHKGLKVISQQIHPNGGIPVVGVAPISQQIISGNVPATTPAAAQIGSIALNNSTDVTFGDKHFYEGPVTIQQFLIDHRDKLKPVNPDGHDNPGFNGQESDHATVAGGKSGEPHSNEKISKTLCFPHSLSGKAITITAILVFLIMLLGIILAQTTNLFGKTSVKSKLGEGEDSRQNIPINSTIDLDNIGGGKVLRIVPRSAWLAQPAQNTLQKLQLPVSLLIVLPLNTENCTTQAECTFRVRFRQTFDIESLRHDDIAYNFLIGGDGNVYEGRGWDYVGVHMKGYNDRSFGFAFIGSFHKAEPSPKQLNVTQLLIDEGVRLGKISEAYKLIGASSLEPTVTEYKADKLYASFAGWPNWT